MFDFSVGLRLGFANHLSFNAFKLNMVLYTSWYISFLMDFLLQNEGRVGTEKSYTQVAKLPSWYVSFFTSIWVKG